MSNSRVKNILKYGVAGAAIGGAVAYDCAQEIPAGIKLASATGAAGAMLTDMAFGPLNKGQGLLAIMAFSAPIGMPAILWYKGLDTLLGRAKTPILIGGGALIGGLYGAGFFNKPESDNKTLTDNHKLTITPAPNFSPH